MNVATAGLGVGFPGGSCAFTPASLRILMHGSSPNSPQTTSTLERRALQPAQNGRLMMLLVVAAVIVGLAVVFTGGSPEATDNVVLAQANTPASPAVVAPAGPAAVVASPATVVPVVEERTVDLDGCQLSVIEIKVGDTGESVECTQKALYAAGLYDGEFTGSFDEATANAVKAMQAQRKLYVDGVVGPQTAESLGIWPGDESFVVRTPAPSPGSVDTTGYELSPVASTGSKAPPVPADTGDGTGKRIVYSRAEQRVWAIDDEERIVRSYLVTGSQYANEVTGRHEVYSKSETTTAWNGAADLPLMVRWLDTERGAIGFHGIPKHRDTGEPYQTTAELGTKLSGGCQRQHLLDAAFMWNFSDIGTPVYVV